MTTAKAPLRAIIVDDEPPARARLRDLLAAEREVEIIGEAGGGSAAIQLIHELRPDLAFLDVQMPGCDGFDVLRAAGPSAPAVIFVTAYDEHAIQAFDVAAVDYLVKPVVEARFRAAVHRAVERRRADNAGDVAAQLSALLVKVPVATVEQIAIWSDGRVVFVRVREIDRIEAADDHVRLHVGKSAYTTRETMSGMEARLPSGFVRVHRSCMVNVGRIREIQHWVKGDYVVMLQDGTRVTSGRTYRDRVRALMP